MSGKKDSMGTLEERFLQKVRKEEDHWYWTGAIGSRKYGMIYDGYKMRRAHVVSYELFVGPVPEGVVVRHKCRIKLCVRPGCLRAGTQADNMEDERKSTCLNGHPQPETGRTASGNCKECMRDYQKEYRKL